ncbi:hypothetical protein EGT74_03450 [Chitinophaga lutea]|uniref:Uncharacterized protein n=1 Tax=Chitinophaga lutea TaxID=2488634 RepID=A0A3N4Q999_9BACT|nr:hypothetical protein [Chitinophaga lutea]RPE12617.1 hypothetical protein EGT74_03450 [Chitinophaga lutea]
MKKIKLAILALTLVCGFVGAYGTSKKAFQLYYIVAGTSHHDTGFEIASSQPSVNCNAGYIGYVCTVQAEEGLLPGYVIPSQDATIVTIYQ